MPGADFTRAAIRGLELPPKEREAKLAAVSADAQASIKPEMDAIQWFATYFLLWKEQGSWLDVLAYAERVAGDGWPRDAAA